MKNNLNFGPGNDPNKTVVHCPTQELAQKVLRMLGNEELDDWQKKLLPNLGVHLWRFGHIETYAKNAYTILPAEEFIRLNTEEQPDAVVRNPFRVGDRVFNHMAACWGEIIAMQGSRAIHVHFSNGDILWMGPHQLSFTEYTLQGFSQERPKELDFDASCLPAWAKYIAMDRNGEWWFYNTEPHQENVRFSGPYHCGPIPSDYTPKNFTGSWSDSLHQIKDGKAVKYSPKTKEEK